MFRVPSNPPKTPSEYASAGECLCNSDQLPYHLSLIAGDIHCKKARRPSALRESLNAVRLVLWDEQSRRMISFGEVHAGAKR
jgi:hypothetical protein